MNRIALSLVALSGAFSAVPAIAQAVTDVVVMRRSVAVPNPKPKATPTPTPTPVRYNCPLVNSVFMFGGGALPPVQYILPANQTDAVSKGRAICEATAGATGCMVAYNGVSPNKTEVYAFTVPVSTFSGVDNPGRYNSGFCTKR